MFIKPLNAERKEIDISEWNQEVKAYFKPLSGFETLVFNDYFLEFYNKSNDLETRFKAGFNAALLALVDESGNALLSAEDMDAVRAASFLPITRVFSYGINAQDGGSLETAKKN